MGRNVFSRIYLTHRWRSGALWKLGILQNIETTWIVIGVVILAGVGIMVSVANAGTKQNIEIDRE